MGLDYLNKKVWHPGSMKNIQKVWDAQQAQLEVIKRQRERAKKLLDEQHNEEMKRIQVEAGLIPKSHLERMDWMYDWGNKLQQQKNSEDFLTGIKKANKKEVKHIFQEEATNKKCEDFVLLHEDPLYAIKKEEMKARQSVMNNPIEMRSIIREVEEDYLRMHPEKKDKKKSKKRESKRRHRSSSNSSSQSSSSSERSRNKKKSRESKLYNNYLQQKFGPILKKDDNGNLVPDYGMHKKKYKTQMQLDEEETRMKLEQMRNNARKLKEDRDRCESQSPEHDRKHSNYENGLANLRKEAFKSTTSNRNYQRHRSRS